MLRNEAQHYNKISLVECEKHENHLYFQERKYVLNSDKLRLCIIQLTHDSVINDHSERAKSYELISRVYWWLNIYKYVQRFVQNCHVCTRFKLFKQWTQEWLCFLSVLERRWCDVFMNYVDFLSLSIFMSITYRYVLIFVNHFIKMKHLILITFKLIASSWIIEIESSSRFVKTRFKSEFLTWVFKLNQDVWLKYLSQVRKLKSSIDLKFSIRLVKTWR